ncbi:O-antigen ligase family protein [bacterium]|nr:O-antigen ligase family protein [bacterium]
MIISVFVFSTFVSSETLGVIALSVFGLSVLNMLIQNGEKFEMNLFEKFIFVWFLIVIISLFGSTLFTLSLKGFFKTVTYMGFYLSVVQFYRKNLYMIYPTMLIIATCAFVQGLIGISQNFKGVEEISTWQDTSSINPEAVMTRIYGTLKPLNPNLFGGYLVAAIPSVFGCIIYLLSNKKYVPAFVASAACFVSMLALVLSGCRGAYVALMFMLLCFALYFGKLIFEKHNELLKKVYLSVLSTFVVIGTMAAMFVTSIRTRIFSIFVFRADSSTSFRFNVYQAAGQMIKDNWLWGIGVGNKNFREIYGLYMKTGFDALSTYNVFTELWVESGIFAILAFLVFLFFVSKSALSYIMQNKPYRTVVAVSLISILSIMVHGFFDTIYFRPQVQFIFWTMVSFISAVLYAENCNSCDK